MQGKLIYEFGPFRLEPAERRLLRQGQPINLSPQLFSLLLAFIENSGKLISKEALRSKVWGNAYVTEDALKVIIGNLRKAIGENGERYIETVRGEGYRFIGPVKMAGEKGDSESNIQASAPTLRRDAANATDLVNGEPLANDQGLAEPGAETPASANTGGTTQARVGGNRRILLGSLGVLIAVATLLGLGFWFRSNNQSKAHVQSSVPPQQSSLYDFEDGEQGWVARPNRMISRVFSSDVHAYEGKRSLAIVFDSPYSRKSQVYIEYPPLKAGRVVTARILCPADNQLSTIAWFVEDREFTWSNDWQPVSRLIPGGWNRFSVRIPADAPTPLARLGIEFTADSVWKGTCYLDAVEWQ